MNLENRFLGIVLPELSIKLTFDECKQILKETLKNQHAFNSFRLHEKAVDKFIGLLINQLSTIMNEGPIGELNEEDERTGNIICMELINGYVLGVQDDDSQKFIEAFTALLNNWAIATQNKEFEKYARTLYVLIHYKKNTLCMIEQMKLLIKYAQQFNTFNPPAFHRSREYIKSLYEDLAQGIIPGDRNK